MNNGPDLNILTNIELIVLMKACRLMLASRKSAENATCIVNTGKATRCWPTIGAPFVTVAVLAPPAT
jgi:hypothetical protein